MNPGIRVWGTLLLLAGFSISMTTGCSSEPGTLTELEPRLEEPAETGMLRLALTGSSERGIEYRLSGARFRITGPGEDVDVDADPARASLDVELPVGSYFVELLPGWTLEQRTGVGSFVGVIAGLASPERMPAAVSAGVATDITFQFLIGTELVEIGVGTINIGIAIHTDGEAASLLGVFEPGEDNFACSSPDRYLTLDFDNRPNCGGAIGDQINHADGDVGTYVFSWRNEPDFFPVARCLADGHDDLFCSWIACDVPEGGATGSGICPHESTVIGTPDFFGSVVTEIHLVIDEPLRSAPGQLGGAWHWEFFGLP